MILRRTPGCSPRTAGRATVPPHPAGSDPGRWPGGAADGHAEAARQIGREQVGGDEDRVVAIGCGIRQEVRMADDPQEVDRAGPGLVLREPEEVDDDVGAGRRRFAPFGQDPHGRRTAHAPQSLLQPTGEVQVAPGQLHLVVRCADEQGHALGALPSSPACPEARGPMGVRMSLEHDRPIAVHERRRPVGSASRSSTALARDAGSSHTGKASSKSSRAPIALSVTTTAPAAIASKTRPFTRPQGFVELAASSTTTPAEAYTRPTCSFGSEPRANGAVDASSSQPLPQTPTEWPGRPRPGAPGRSLAPRPTGCPRTRHRPRVSGSASIGWNRSGFVASSMTPAVALVARSIASLARDPAVSTMS